MTDYYPDVADVLSNVIWDKNEEIKKLRQQVKELKAENAKFLGNYSEQESIAQHRANVVMSGDVKPTQPDVDKVRQVLREVLLRVDATKTTQTPFGGGTYYGMRRVAFWVTETLAQVGFYLDDQL